MEIRVAKIEDYDAVMGISRAIYPEGDYIADTWNTWLEDGCARIIYEGDRIVGSFNISIDRGQGWVEGTRIHPDYRRRGLGTAVLRYAEDLTRSAGGYMVRSLIEVNNAPSILRSEKAGWLPDKRWTWYRLKPNVHGKFEFAPPRPLYSVKYADSWRIYDYDGIPNTVFFADSAATIIRSRYFPRTVLFTVLEADDLAELAAYAGTVEAGLEQHKGHPGEGCDGVRDSNHCQPSSGLHVASCCKESLFDEHFERIATYHLWYCKL